MRFFIKLSMTLLLGFMFAEVQATPLTFREALEIASRNNPELQAEMDKAQAMRGAFIQSGLYPNPQL
ncbi:TPA: TolC family protein, partial [Legionella bozemanae]